MSGAISRVLMVGVLVAGASLAMTEVGNTKSHLRLTASNPAKDSTLAATPKQISLWYSQVPNLKLSRVSLSGPRGAVTVGKVERDGDNPKLLTAAIGSQLPDGKYVISWITASSDGHPIKGEIPFSMKAAR